MTKVGRNAAPHASAWSTGEGKSFVLTFCPHLTSLLVAVQHHQQRCVQPCSAQPRAAHGEQPQALPLGGPWLSKKSLSHH